LLALQATLRAPNGCPWDREQSHESLRTFLLEETHEVLDAMESGDPEKFASELGDLLLQIVFHSLIASETGRFNIDDVIEAVHTKMVRRHPHVFGEVKAATSAQVLKNWERLKAEKRRAESSAKKSKAGAATGRAGGGAPDGTAGAAESLLSGVPRSLPALMEANQLTRRAARIGFDWENAEQVLDKLGEEARELRQAIAQALPQGCGPGNIAAAEAGGGAGKGKSAANRMNAAIEEEAGDLLFAAANVARFLGLDPELALKKATRKFTGRFQWMEQEAARHGRKLADTERAKMEELWNQSKSRR
jgi:tetrapyrrole methylase family protein/MazG family protein